jgi:hypothetical protein
MTIRAWQSLGIRHANEHGWYTKYDRSVLILEQVKHLIRIVAGRYHMSATVCNAPSGKARTQPCETSALD